MNPRTVSAGATSAPSARRFTERRRAAVLSSGALLALALVGCQGAGSPVSPSPTITPTILTASATPSPAPGDTDPSATTPPAEAKPSFTPSTDPASGLPGVTVALAGAEAMNGGIEVRSFVADYIGEGTCTATAVAEDGTKLTAERDAKPDATTTVCPPIMIEGVTAATWKVTVTFQNSERAGTSAPETVEVHE